MTEQAVESLRAGQTIAFREIEPLPLRNLRAEDSVNECLSGLKELVKAPPFSPGKQSFDMSLKQRLASVDNSYSGMQFNSMPISETNDVGYWMANERPLSPGTDTSSSSRSTAPSPPTMSCLLDEDDINESPRIISDSSSEPSSETSAAGLLVSPPSARRPGGHGSCCGSSNRPVVHLNLSNNSLKSSSGSSPFRESSNSLKKYTRTKSEPSDVVTENSNINNSSDNVVQRLAF